MPHILNYCRGLAIVHGKSEKIMAEYIKSNLRIPIKIVARSNGDSSIQINGLVNFIKSNCNLKNFSALKNEYNPEVDFKTRRFIGFKIFTIMDIDDCDSNITELYKSGNMFNDNWLSSYIVPIWNDKNFDDVMFRAGLIEKIPETQEKKKRYTKIFPINHGMMNIDEINEFNERMKKNNKTNLEEFITYCLDNTHTI